MTLLLTLTDRGAACCLCHLVFPVSDIETAWKNLEAVADSLDLSTLEGQIRQLVKERQAGADYEDQSSASQSGELGYIGIREITWSCWDSEMATPKQSVPYD